MDVSGEGVVECRHADHAQGCILCVSLCTVMHSTDAEVGLGDALCDTSRGPWPPLSACVDMFWPVTDRQIACSCASFQVR